MMEELDVESQIIGENSICDGFWIVISNFLEKFSWLIQKVLATCQLYLRKVPLSFFIYGYFIAVLSDCQHTVVLSVTVVTKTILKD